MDSETEEEFHAVMENIKVEDIELPEYIKKIEPEDSILDVTDDNKPFPSLCRLCATAANNMMDMLRPTKMHKDIIEKIEYCSLPIEVKESDSLPTGVCELCLAKLEMSYQFRKNIVDAKKRLIMLDKQSSYYCDKKTEKYPQFPSSSIGQYDATEIETKKEEFNTIRDTDYIHMPILSPQSVTTDDHNTLSNLKIVDKNRRVNSSSNKYLNTDPSSNALNSVVDSSMDSLSDGEMRMSEETSVIETHSYRITRSRSKQNNPSREMSLLRKKPSCNTAQPTEDLFRAQSQSTVEGNHNHSLECTMCKRQFGSLRALKMLRKTCRKSLPRKIRFTCGFCDKSFRRKAELIIHIRSHTGERPYRCDFCPAKFKQKSHKDCHHQSHRDERPYSCNFCPSKFKRKSNRDRHHKIHRR